MVALHATFTTAVWMVNRVHSHTTIVGTLAEPPGLTRFAVRFVLVLDIADLPNRRHAFDLNPANLG